MRRHSDSLYRFSELYTYAYDHADRLMSANYKLGQRNEIALVRYSYDELGRISQKKSYDKTLGTTNYTYNIQSQITSIDANYYDKRYHYADLTGSGAGPLYNGDVSECVTLAGGAVIDSVRYSYDDFDRVTAETNLAATGKLSAQWEYDSHSNVTHVERTDKNGVLFDDLDLTYYGNQIDEVNDSGDDIDSYSTLEYRDGAADIALYGITGRERLYDANGNMTADLDRKIVTVRYNLLNLPDTVQFFDGSRTVNRYLADGTKVSSVHHTVQDGVVVTLVGSVCNVDILPNVTMSGTAYCQNIEYDISGNGTPVIKRIHNSEGYVTSYTNAGVPYYTERDLQGNITSVWHAGYGYPVQMTDYYADGLPKNNSYGTSFQPYLYSGKELLSIHGYDCYDYGARHSQTALGRFTTIDPLAEKNYGISPYTFCNGNPVRFIDPDGRSWVEREYGGVTEIYYDRNVASQADIDKEYGENSGVKYIASGSTRFGYTFENDDVNNRNGRVYDSGGNQISQREPIQSDKFDIFVGVDDNSVDAKTLHKNLFGTSYTGPDNPGTYKNLDGDRMDNYDYLPRNFSEIYSYRHDRAYDSSNAAGKWDALLNTNVLGADIRLASGNIVNMFKSPSYIDKGRSYATAIAFGLICAYKSTPIGQGFSIVYNAIKK